MSEHGHDRGFDFPHDGEHGRNCTGYGCDCDERNYGHYHHSKGSNGSSAGIYVALILALILGYGINELLGAIIMIGVLFYILLAR